MIPQDPDRAISPLPSPNGHGGAEDLEVTPLYTPLTGQSPRSERSGQLDTLRLPRPSSGRGRARLVGPLPGPQLIGEGGIGLVFLAEDTQLSRPVALKVIKPELAGADGVQSGSYARPRLPPLSSTTTSSRSTRWARTTVSCTWPWPCSTASPWCRSGTQAVARTPAANRPRDRRRASPRPTDGLIHRDIKPANIWLEERPGGSRSSTSGSLGPNATTCRSPRTGRSWAPPRTWPPSRPAGRNRPPRDLFSLGCVLYRLSTGRLPFEGGDDPGRLVGFVVGYPRSLRLIRSRREACARRIGTPPAGQGPGGPARVGPGGRRGDQGDRA